MYWPNGVPRVYAVNGPGIVPSSSGEDEELAAENVQENADLIAQNERRRSSKVNASAWANEPIDGLCVSRSGHLFATMTKSSISVGRQEYVLSY
jgi:hypothetical protein